MEAKRIDIYCFSGTGNTLLVAEKIAETLNESGRKARLFRMEKCDPKKVDPENALGLAFTVACQRTYPFVWDFINRLPESPGAGAFMADTLAGFSGGVVGPLKKILKKKGYRPLGAVEIRMPNNFRLKNINGSENELLRNKGLEKAERFARQLMAGKTSWGRVPVLSDVMGALCGVMAWPMMKKMGDKYRVNRDVCTKCGLCEKLCPADNIVMKDYPEFGDHCRQCLRCFSFCPTQAIYVQGAEFARYRAVAAKDILNMETNV